MQISVIRVAATLVLLASLLLSTAAVAQGEATVSGHVKGNGGDPKQFSSVSLDGPGRYVATTDTEGAFAIPNVKPGRYTIRVRQGDHLAEFSRDIGSGALDLVVRW